MLFGIRAGIYNKRTLIVQDCVKFRRRIAWQGFRISNFADFPDVVRVKKSRFHSVAGGVSLQQHLLLSWI